MSRDPLRKKELSLSRDRRYAYGNSPHARTVSRARRREEHRYRQRFRQVLSRSDGVKNTEGEDIEPRVQTIGRTFWRKTPDYSLGTKLRLREMGTLWLEVSRRRNLEPPLEIQIGRRLKGQGLHPAGIDKICRQIRPMTYPAYHIDPNFDLPLLRLLNRTIRRIRISSSGQP